MSAEERFKAIRERLDAATPGNWVASRDPGEDEPWFVASNLDGYRIGCVALWSLEAFQYDYPPQVEQIADDAEFIANAPADIAFLLDALAQVEAERDALRAERDAFVQVDPFNKGSHGRGCWAQTGGPCDCTMRDGPFYRRRTLASGASAAGSGTEEPGVSAP